MNRLILNVGKTTTVTSSKNGMLSEGTVSILLSKSEEKSELDGAIVQKNDNNCGIRNTKKEIRPVTGDDTYKGSR